jgi:outer membrane protein OmpA-like peptidoglycan-associated protein
MNIRAFFTSATVSACLLGLSANHSIAETHYTPTSDKAVVAMREAAKPAPKWESKGFGQLEDKGIRTQSDVHIGMPVEFEFGKYRLTQAGKDFLRPIAREMINNPDMQSQRVLLEGHTDWIGSDRDNQYLSERRAKTVRDFLISQGVNSRLLISEGQGERYPLCKNSNSHNRQVNRRVEMVILKGGTETGSRGLADESTCRG